MHAIYLLVSMRSKSLCRNRVSDTKVAFLTLWGFHSESGWRRGWPLEIPFIASRRNRISPREFPSFRPAGVRVGLTEKNRRQEENVEEEFRKYWIPQDNGVQMRNDSDEERGAAGELTGGDCGHGRSVISRGARAPQPRPLEGAEC